MNQPQVSLGNSTGGDAEEKKKKWINIRRRLNLGIKSSSRRNQLRETIRWRLIPWVPQLCSALLLNSPTPICSIRWASLNSAVTSGLHLTYYSPFHKVFKFIFSSFVLCQCRRVVWQVECYCLRFWDLRQDSKVWFFPFSFSILEMKVLTFHPCHLLLQLQGNSTLLDPNSYLNTRATYWVCRVQCCGRYFHITFLFFSIETSLVLLKWLWYLFFFL